MTRSRGTLRLPLRATAVGVVVVLVTSLAPARPAGAVTSVLFARQNWSRNGTDVTTFAGVAMKTRGFLPDTCVLAPLPCFTQPEDTAKTHAIRALVLLHPTVPPLVPPPTPIESVVKLFDKVHWEVGPNGGWRTDVLVDDGAVPTILEVKRWQSETTRGEVDLELNNPNNQPAPKGPGYIQKFANDVGITVDRNAELNEINWLESYLDDGFGFSCVWADPDPNAHAGNIYFAPLEETPFFVSGVPVYHRAREKRTRSALRAPFWAHVLCGTA